MIFLRARRRMLPRAGALQRAVLIAALVITDTGATGIAPPFNAWLETCLPS